MDISYQLNQIIINYDTVYNMVTKRENYTLFTYI